MKNLNDDNYILNQDYHGDIKLTKTETLTPTEKNLSRKKVDLSKPTDKTIKPITNLNIQTPSISKDSAICLTKPQDLTKIDKHTTYQPKKVDLSKSTDTLEHKSKMILNIIRDEFLSCNPIILILSVGVIILGIVTFYHDTKNIFSSIAYILFVLISVLISIFSYVSPIFLISSIYILIKSISCHNKNNIIKSIIMAIISIIGCIWLFFLIFIN